MGERITDREEVDGTVSLGYLLRIGLFCGPPAGELSSELKMSYPIDPFFRKYFKVQIPFKRVKDGCRVLFHLIEDDELREKIEPRK
ncbi:hypothetical protein LCGC14_0245510 [marine sediment metagenome]|uniref:Uncharacterized protein n=1 Tax=marine sediment metagenome TaxID=412755 RepID=A0A0F9U629_9ZZZZ